MTTTRARVLDPARVDAWRLGRQHLLARQHVLARTAPDASQAAIEGGASPDIVANVAADIVGVQAQVLSAAELSLAIRSPRIGRQDVRDALADRRLVRSWAMRGTLHLVPSGLMPTLAAALRTRQLWRRPAWLRYFGVTEDDMERLIAAVTAVLADGRPRTRAALARDVSPELGAALSERLRASWGDLLKPVAGEGLLCQGPGERTTVTFVRPDRWLADWRDEDPAEARDRLWLDYLAAYGHATVEEMARWWGVPPADGKRIHRPLATRLAAVTVDGVEGWLRPEDLEAIAHTEPLRGQVRLLGPFDPLTVGGGLRSRLIPAQHAKLVSRTAGWISPVVLVDGRVAGVWSSATMAADPRPARANGSAQRITIQAFPGVKVSRSALERQVALIAGIDGTRWELVEGIAHPTGGGR